MEQPLHTIMRGIKTRFHCDRLIQSDWFDVSSHLDIDLVRYAFVALILFLLILFFTQSVIYVHN